MLNYRTTQPNGIPMPLLMGYTHPAKIREAENDEPVVYDPISQIVFDMRYVGTKCLKTSGTKIPNNSGLKNDKKNEIDDTKRVI